MADEEKPKSALTRYAESRQAPPLQIKDNRVDLVAVRGWLVSKGKDGGKVMCPVSGHAEWLIAPDYVLAPGSGDPPGTGYPMVLMVCRQCAYALLVSAQRMGLLSAPLTGGSEPTDG